MRLEPLFASTCAALCLLAPPLRASVAPPQDAEQRLHEAYWVETRDGDLARARDLYRAVLDARDATPAVRDEAKRALAGLEEELAAQHLAALLPPDALVYAELSSPGDHLRDLVRQLGLLGEGSAGIGQQGGRRLAISPDLIEGLVGVRGAALALTSIAPGAPPKGVLVIHPGSQKVLRGLIDTAVGAAADPVREIDGLAVWSVQGQAFLCSSERLIIAASDVAGIEGVLARLHGRESRSLLDSAVLAQAFADRDGAGDLLRFCVAAEPFLPMIKSELARQGAHSPQAAGALSLLDLDHLRSVSGRVGVGEGLSLEVALDLAPGHRNVIFNLLRRPTIERSTLELVPSGAALFLAERFNEPAAIAPIARDSAGQPVVTLTDLGREVYGNWIDFALFCLPAGEGDGGALPDAALALRVNDVERSKAMWVLLLDSAARLIGATSTPPLERVASRAAGIELSRTLLAGVPVFLGTSKNQVAIGLQQHAVEQTFAAAAGHSIARDPAFARFFEASQQGNVALVGVAVGRTLELALPFAPPHERDQLEPLIDLFEETVVEIAVRHSETRLGLAASVRHLPDVSGLVAQQLSRATHGRTGRPASDALGVGRGAPAPARDPAREIEPSAVAVATSRAQAQQHARVQARAAAARAVAEARAPAGVASHRAEFMGLVHAGRDDQARDLGLACAARGSEVDELNDFAWSLLTDERFERRFDDVALALARRANELSKGRAWNILDTLALAEFRAGNAARAVELESAALDLVGNAEGRADVAKALERFRAAQSEQGSRIDLR